jgi:hypothetical protein
MGIRKLFTAGLMGLAFGTWSCSKSGNPGTDPGPVGNAGAAPTVLTTAPPNLASDIPVHFNIIITFSLGMDTAATRAAITASPGIAGSFGWDAGGTQLVWNPDSALGKNTTYTVTVGTAAKSKAGAALAAAEIFSFTTGMDTVTSNDSIPGVDTSHVTRIAGGIYRKEDNVYVAGANVVLYDANNNNPLLRTSSDAYGRYAFRIDSGNYYIGVTAMGRIPSPAPGGRYTPFHLDPLTTYTRNFYLRRDSSGLPVGALIGKIEADGLANPAGILVIATAPDSSSYSATTGPDGTFIFNNLPVGAGYTLVAFHAGLAGDTVKAQADVVQGVTTQGVVLKLTVEQGRSLTGQVQFLAATGITADITLVDPETRLAIPGLRTFNFGGATTYKMDSIPLGAYIVWGSYLNDGYVMDPDHIRKFGLPKVTYLPEDTSKIQDFAFTRAIQIVSPTNPPDSLYPAPVLSMQPWFVWKHEASAQEIVIEVFDSKGECIWGGWDSAGTIRHGQILAHPGGLDSVQFDFDGTARSPLLRSETYSWKIYADGDRAPGIQKFISSTEDLRGLFMPGVGSIPNDDFSDN